MIWPPQNLPPESQQWVRAVQDQVSDLDRTTTVRDQTQNNTLSGLANALASLGDTVANLSDQVDRIDELVRNQIKTASSGFSKIGFAVPETITLIDSRNIAVPNGYTTATVFVVCDTSIYNTSTNSGYLRLRADIGGTAGGSALSRLNGSGGSLSLSASAIRTVTGLAEGSTIRVGGIVYGETAFPAHSSNILNVNATVTFTR